MTKVTTNLLLVEDEPPIRRFLRTSLLVHNYKTIEAETGARALELLADPARDLSLIVLDLGLPDMDGLEVLARIRAESHLPVVVLSCRADERSIVRALEIGANDYVRKPFGMGELVARLNTALRHQFHERGGEPVFRNGPLTVDLIHRRVALDGTPVKLSPIEFSLLQLLVTHAGKVITHPHILRDVWGDTDINVQHIRTYIRQLRRKIELDPDKPTQIVTESGVGYRLQVIDP